MYIGLGFSKQNPYCAFFILLEAQWSVHSKKNLPYFPSPKKTKGSMRLTRKKRYFHTNFVNFFESVNYHKKNEKTKQSAFHTDLVNMTSFFYYESYIGLFVKWKVHNGGLVLKNLFF